MVQSQSIRNTSNYAKSRVGVGIPLLRGYVYPLLSEVIELLFHPLLRPYGLIAGLIVLIIAALPWTGQWQKQYRTGLRHLKPRQQWSGHDSLRGGGLQQQQIGRVVSIGLVLAGSRNDNAAVIKVSLLDVAEGTLVLPAEKGPAGQTREGRQGTRRALVTPPIEQQDVAGLALFHHEVVDGLDVGDADFRPYLLGVSGALVGGRFPPNEDGDGRNGQGSGHHAQDSQLGMARGGHGGLLRSACMLAW